MYNNITCFFFTLVIFITGCHHSDISDGTLEDTSGTGLNKIVKHDTSVFYLDSGLVKQIIFQDAFSKSNIENLESFYKKRNNAFAWMNHSGINEYARNFINLLNYNEVEKVNDSFPDHHKIHELLNTISEDGYQFSNADIRESELELLLTVNFFDYAKRNWKGISDDEFKKVNWFMERKKLNYESLLDTILKADPTVIASFEPVYRQYGLLKKFLLQYRSLMIDSECITWPDPGKVLKKGDSSSVVAFIKKKLYLFGDSDTNNRSGLFDNNMVDAVKKFQKRHGLKENGIIDAKTLNTLNVPVQDRIKQILINMERCRWVPYKQQGDFLAVNIPDFKLLVYHDDSIQWSCNVIVGKSKSADNTVIFNDYLEYIVFSPYWNIPKEILIKETLPEIKKDHEYLLRHDMEIVNDKGESIAASSIGWNDYVDNFPYIIRQKPGKNNALGRVKFLFPNSYDIYMHDTPERSLFDETSRAFSHGCIRVEEPYKLAGYLLKNDTTWTESKILSFMNGGKQKFVKLKKRVPVFIAYFTAWVDRNGKLNFRDDIYHHDAKMKELLFADQ